MNEQTIFTAALERDPAERSAFLEEACGTDSKLRERVQDLLRLHGNAGDFLERPAAGASPTIDQPITEKTGTQIGPYKLLQKLGQGGMGVVYMAEQKKPVERRVALKIIKPGMDTQQVIARFEAERQALAMMDHPNIAHVLDAGTTDSGRPFFAMELVKGVPITQYCDEKCLTLRQRLELFVDVCHAVQHAHQKGIIHRDIKPSNVLVAEYDDHAVSKIIDFGVAKAVQQQLTEKTMFTQVGQVVGTLEYMSPEQAKLNQLDIDTRSDVYSLGVLLYELLTGATPFDRQRLQSAAFDEMLRILREEEPPKPSTKLSSSETLPSIAANRHVEPRKLSVLVRGELDWIVMKAIEKDRSRRYETANGFAADIQRYLNDVPVEACQPSAAYRFRKFAQRNKTTLATASMLMVALILGMVGTAWQAVRAKQQAVRAIEAEGTAKTERETANLERNHAVDARQLAEDRLSRAVKAEDAAREQSERVSGLLASSYADRGQALCEQGEIGRGMVWLAHSLRIAPESAHDLEWVVRTNLAAWHNELHSLRTVIQHSSDVLAVAFSPDGSRILTGCSDGIIQLWDANTGHPVGKSIRHEAWSNMKTRKQKPFRGAAFSPDGSRIVTASYEQTAHVWNATTMEPIGHPLEHAVVDEPVEIRDRVCVVAFSPDGSRIVTASCQYTAGSVRLWDADTLEPLGEPFERGAPVAVRFCPDGLHVVAKLPNDGNGLSTPLVHQLWNVEHDRPVGPPVEEGGNNMAAISPDGSIFATGKKGRQPGLWRAETGEPALERLVPRGTRVAFSPNGARLISVGAGLASVLWDAATGEPIGAPLPQQAQTVAFNADGTRILTASGDLACLWEVASDRSAGRVVEHADRVIGAGYCLDGLRALTQTDGSLQLRDGKTGQPIGKPFREQRNMDGFRQLTLSPNGSQILVRSKPPRLGDVATGKLTDRILPNILMGAAFSPDGSRIVTGFFAGYWRLWDTATLKPIG